MYLYSNSAIPLSGNNFKEIPNNRETCSIYDTFIWCNVIWTFKNHVSEACLMAWENTDNIMLNDFFYKR